MVDSGALSRRFLQRKQQREPLSLNLQNNLRARKLKYGILSFLILGVFLMPRLSFAFDLHEMMQSMSFTPASKDLSIKYLASLFGSVTSVQELSTAVPSFLRVVFEIFNGGLLALSGLFIFYSLVKLLAETSTNGETLGKMTTVWVTLRCALSTGLLVPQASGYSTINVLILWLVVQSVGLADLLWNRTLDYVTSNGTVIANFQKQDDASANVNYYLVSNGAASLVSNTQWSQPNDKLNTASILKSLTCAYSVQRALEYRRTAIFNEYLDVINDPKAMASEIKEAKTQIANYAKSLTSDSFKVFSNEDGVFKFPAINVTNLPERLARYVPGEINCGSYRAHLGDDYDQVRENAALAVINALDRVAETMVDQALQYGDQYAAFVKQQVTNAPSSLTSLNQVNNYPLGTMELVSTALDYQENTSTIWRKALTDQEDTELMDQLKALGWLYAGAYYQVLHSSNEAKQQNVESMYTEGISDTYTFLSDSDINQIASNSKNEYVSNFSSLRTLIDAAAQYGVAYSYLNLVSYNNDTGALDKAFEKLKRAFVNNKNVTTRIVGAGVLMAVPLVGPPFAIGFFRDIPLMILHERTYNLIHQKWQQTIQSTQYLAIEKLAVIGEEMVNTAVKVYQDVMKLSISVAAGTFGSKVIALGVAAASAPGTFWGALSGAVDVAVALADLNVEVAKLANTVIFLMLPVLLGIIGPLLVCGLVLVVYVPLIPLLLFLFGGINWLISIIVVMLAAPIICFLMLWGANSQDNPLLTKEAEKFVMQMVALFFRPILMLTGLIVGMLLAEVGCNLLNEVFARMVDIVVGTGVTEVDGVGVSWDSMVVLFKIIGILTIYTFTLSSLVNLSFSSIYLLYNEVMKVIGVNAPIVGSEQKAIDQIQGKTEQSAEGSKQGLEKAAADTQRLNMSVDSLQGTLNKRNRDPDRIKRRNIRSKSRIVAFFNQLKKSKKGRR